MSLLRWFWTGMHLLSFSVSSTTRWPSTSRIRPFLGWQLHHCCGPPAGWVWMEGRTGLLLLTNAYSKVSWLLLLLSLLRSCFLLLLLLLLFVFLQAYSLNQKLCHLLRRIHTFFFLFNKKNQDTIYEAQIYIVLWPFLEFGCAETSLF